MTKPLWMVRAGSNSSHVEEFIEKGFVAVGFSDELGAIPRGTSRDQIVARLKACYPDRKEGKIINAAGQLYRFHEEIANDDEVVTYDAAQRCYFLGTVTGKVQHVEQQMPYQRNVKWTRRVSRDALDVATRNTLGATLTLFRPNDEAASDLRIRSVAIDAPLQVDISPASAKTAIEVDMGMQTSSVIAQAGTFVEDMINALDPDEMERFVAGILRAMGYKARVSPKGADRGVDIFASPDGLGLQEPRIFVEVKHRDGKIGAPIVRSFLGGRKPGDRCLFVSTGGFAKDALYEADRSNVPLRLIDLPLLRELVLENYEKLDEETRRLVPLTRVYLPAPTDA